jgi:hypothetical protein
MITCQICGLCFNKITNTHLKKHNTTSSEYQIQYPDAPIMTEEVRASYTAHLKGRSYEDIYGVDIAKSLRERRQIDAWRQYENDEQRSLRRKNKWKGYEEISGTRWSSYQKGAEARGFIFEITIEYAWELFLKQEQKCAYTGIPIYFDMSLDNLRKYGHQGGTASLDRIDSLKGYIMGNVQWVHKDANKMKMDLPEEDFFRMVKLIYEYKQFNKNLINE